MQNRAFQFLLISSLIAFSWLAMMAVHELGHVLHVWVSGGTVERVVLHPLSISRTDVWPNPDPLLVDPMAMTLGHVILGRTAAALDVARSHESIHVRQYERWGPFFGPAYLLCSLVLWLRGRDAYRNNPFEREAFRSER